MKINLFLKVIKGINKSWIDYSSLCSRNHLSVLNKLPKFPKYIKSIKISYMKTELQVVFQHQQDVKYVQLVYFILMSQCAEFNFSFFETMLKSNTACIKMCIK